MPVKGLVLITGVNGYIASRVAEAFLQAGYSVRGTVRSKRSATALLEALSSHADKLEIVEVPDITAPGAFDAAVQDVDAVAHLASPVSLTFTDPEPVLQTAVNGATEMLKSAIKASTIKSFVLMSSYAALLAAPSTGKDIIMNEEGWNNWAETLCEKLGKNTPGPAIYAASKAATEKAFWKFRDDNKPSFTMTAINPCLVTGPPLIAPTSPGAINPTSLPIWNVLTGQDLSAAAMGREPPLVDVRDVARMVLFGIEEPEKADGQRYLTAGAWGPTQAIADILRKAYPDLRDTIQVGNPGEAYLEGYKFPSKYFVDTSKALKATGTAWIPFEKTVLDTAEVLKTLL